MTGAGAWAREPRTVVLDAVDSPTSIPAPFAVLVESGYVPVPLEFEPHTHPLHELVWVRGGTMTVLFADRVVTVPDGHGLWIPAGMVHSGRMTGGASLSDALFDPERAPVSFPDVVAVEVTPLLAALLIYLGRDDLAAVARLHAESVVFDVLAPAPQQLALRVPDAPWIGAIVECLLNDPTDGRTLGAWAEVAGCSERTLARLFRRHTGLSFLQWRGALRVHRALALLGEGMAVHEVSEHLGYAQPSTFIASFKKVMGATPGGRVRLDG